MPAAFPSLRERDGIPSGSALQELDPCGREILLAVKPFWNPTVQFQREFHLFD